MYEPHPVFIAPSDQSTTIWRYLDLARLVSLVSSGSLWFARANTLDDPHEGSISPQTLAARRPWPTLPDRPDWDPDAAQAVVMRQRADVRRTVLGHTFVNCWHMSPGESMAMWSIYGSSRQGVAIKSTFQQLCDSLTSDDPTHVGMVTYIDPDTEPVPKENLLSAYVYKRRAFEYEREVRAVILGAREDGKRALFTEPGPPGLKVDVNLTELITEVVVAPGIDQWLVDVVTDVVAAFAPDTLVRRSSLDVDPVY